MPFRHAVRSGAVLEKPSATEAAPAAYRIGMPKAAPIVPAALMMILFAGCRSGPAAHGGGEYPYIFPDRRPRIDAVLARPYTPETPFGSSGGRLWATSPQGFGFDDGVHFLTITDFVPFKMRIPGFKAGAAHSTPSCVRVEAETGAELSASASYTFAGDGVDRPLTKPFTPEKRWTCWSSGRRDDRYEIGFGASASVAGVVLHFYDDVPNGGGCAPPESVAIEAFAGDGWQEVSSVVNDRGAPSPGANRFAFPAVEAERLRFKFHHRGKDYYTGLYGVEPIYERAPRVAPVDGLSAETIKFITDDDCAVVVVRMKNSGIAPAEARVEVELPWTGVGETNTGPDAAAMMLFGRSKFHDTEMQVAFAVGGTGCKFEQRAGDRCAVRTTTAPGGTSEIVLAFSAEPFEETNPAVIHPGLLRRLARFESPGDDFPAEQSAEYQQWFDHNVATFECSDPLVTKQFWHRAYLLKKNFMDPRLGALQHRTCSEGRWRADWYSNVISYGAGHQIREARWFADPSYAWGHLATWAENERPDGIFPSHITTAGQRGGQYTDWISSTALDVMAVHPQRASLEKHLDALARNAKAWIDVYDKDGDALPVVDSHWWTGMEWQPSFFYFQNYDPTEGDDPAHKRAGEADLERVDLASYAYGDAENVARCADLLGRGDVAKEMHALASRIRSAVEKKLWNKDAAFFLSNRYQDDAPAMVKEEIGVYPFYFGLPIPGAGFEAAWNSILNPDEFWGPWPVRSCSAQCPAYSPANVWGAVKPIRSGCMWNGPSWPHANSIIMSAMARTLRDYPPCALRRTHLFELFNSFAQAQFKDGRIAEPWTGEYYNSDTGAWLTRERDYNHSTYLDVLIPEMIGLRPRLDDVLEVDPLVPAPAEGGWGWFLLDGQYYRGHRITIVFDPDPAHRRYPSTSWGAPVPAGFTVYADGVQLAHRNDLGRLTAALPR